jgi:hypothetical protein
MDQIVKLAFFDDYPFERGHHPDYLAGLALATNAPIYCPESFLDGRPDAAGPPHRAMLGDLNGLPARTTENLIAAYEDAEKHGADVLANLFLDENWHSCCSKTRKTLG